MNNVEPRPAHFQRRRQPSYASVLCSPMRRQWVKFFMVNVFF